MAAIPLTLSADYQTLCRRDAQCRLCTGRALIHHRGNVRLWPCGCCSRKRKYYLYFHHGKQPLINRKPLFKQHLSCRVKWKADLCSLVKHHLCWHGWGGLCWAGRIQRTCMKHGTPLTDICCGSLTPKCQHGYRLPPPLLPALGARQRRITIRKPPQLYMRMHHSWAGSNVHTLKTMPGKQEHYSRLWQDDCMFKIKRKSMLVFWKD